MAKTVIEINNELILYECQIADMATKYVIKEMYGQQDLACMLNKITYMVNLLELLSVHLQIIAREHLTQTELEDELEKLNDLCGCATCKSIEEIVDDTVSTAMLTFVRT